MTCRLLPLAVAAALLPACFAQSAPVSAEQPLTAIPYSPSLDLKDMDRTTDPCVDFYQYVCGGWRKNNHIPADQASWSVYGKLSEDNRRLLWGILEEDAKASQRTPVQQKIGDYYAACMDTGHINALGLKPIQPELDAIAAIHGRSQLAAFLRQGADRRGLYFLTAGGQPDPKNAGMMIVAIGAGGMGLPDRDYYTKSDAKSQETRQRYVAYMAHLLVLAGEPQAQADEDAASTMKIETALATSSLTRVERRNPYNTFHPMTVAEVDALAPALDVAAYLREERVPDSVLSKINVAQPKFLAALQTELASEPLEVIKAYLRVHALSAAASSLSQPLEDAQFDFYSRYLRGVPEMQARWKRCEGQVDRNLGEALGQEFVFRDFAPGTKQKVTAMTEQIEQAMQREIENLDWMSPQTKQAAIAKLHAVRNKIGYPEKWRDYSTLTIERDDYHGNVVRAHIFNEKRDWAKVGKPVDRNEWFMSPPTVNAYYDPQTNDINFPAGVLQPPLYDSKEDDAPNYGDTGGTIGHELTHAFDDEGRQFDGAGNLRDWWTPADAKGFEDRINCQRDQYATYVIVDDIHINSKLTSGEDVADLGGTLLAYEAWKKQTAGMNLQDRDGFAPAQRFFIGYAQWACENERPENLRVSAITDPHSPGKYRVNGIVSDLPQFAAAFGCKAGQPMVAAKACRIW
ncbi:MAG TPA: M13 family metallopeptidase [Acidobacteriaceae bacterium]|jgi:endothelin-converting enzyme/putative endopeptidase|nr:M13 family metallopeptidase [Acidobacteriaceae bacterium]